MSRAMTLIEVLLALALLGVLAGVGVSWITTTSSLATEQSKRLQWQGSADALLQSIHNDLSLGDFNPARDNARATRRIQITGSTLSIRTRAGGVPVRRVYSHRASTGAVNTWVIGPDTRIPAVPPQDSATVLGIVDSFELVIDDDYTTLDATISSALGESAHRRYRIGEIP